MAKERITKRTEPLLIVDDRESIRTSLERVMEMFFEEVVTAASPAEAEDLLRSRKPKYLLTDYYLEDDPPTTDLIPSWRELCPTLTHVALMTGTKESSIRQCPGVDMVFTKPLNLKQVIAFFRGE